MKPEHAWFGLGVGVATFDLLCPEGQTLSEAFRRQPRVLQIGEIALLAGHLLDIAPNYDPIHKFHKTIKRGSNGPNI